MLNSSHNDKLSVKIPAELGSDLKALESQLLGTLIIKGGQIIPDIQSVLTPDDFFFPDYKVIYKIIVDLFNRNTSPPKLRIIPPVANSLNSVFTLTVRRLSLIIRWTNFPISPIRLYAMKTLMTFCAFFAIIATARISRPLFLLIIFKLYRRRPTSNLPPTRRALTILFTNSRLLRFCYGSDLSYDNSGKHQNATENFASAHNFAE